MLTVDALRQIGVNTKEGLGRCLNNEAFYLRLVNMALDDAAFDRLADALGSGDTQAAFEAAHALKGSLGNLALTPVYAPVAELTELLRAGQTDGSAALLEEVLRQRGILNALREG